MSLLLKTRAMRVILFHRGAPQRGDSCFISHDDLKKLWALPVLSDKTALRNIRKLQQYGVKLIKIVKKAESGPLVFYQIKLNVPAQVQGVAA